MANERQFTISKKTKYSMLCVRCQCGQTDRFGMYKDTTGRMYLICDRCGEEIPLSQPFNELSAYEGK